MGNRSLRNRIAHVGLLAFASVLVHEREARADTEAWLWIENRLPLVRTARPEAGRVDLRVFGDFRFNRRSEGLGTVFARLGPLFYLSDWLFVGTHGSFLSSRNAEERWLQQARVELEPTFFGRLGDFTIVDRNRGEYRMRDGLPNFFFYRNLLRISYAPEGARWIPYVWNEVLFNATRSELAENRASVGLGRLVGSSTRVDLGYIFRSRRDVTWTHDHVLNLFFFFDVAPVVSRAPPAPPLPVAEPPTPAPITPPPPPAPPVPAQPEDGG